ncbi:MAG: YigZ family protein [Bacteroidota bacterium]
MIAHFKTIAARSEGIYKEKGSKFIGIALPVSDIKAVAVELDQLRQTYHDARHHCYAYMLGADQKVFRANDDGEPNHSAGDPILGQIKANGLTDVLIVVIRYFGGTKLGVSGLINAYKAAAHEALQNTTFKTVQITQLVTLSYAYEATNEVMRLINAFDLEIVSQVFQVDCKIQVKVPVIVLETVWNKIVFLQKTGSAINLDIS